MWCSLHLILISENQIRKLFSNACHHFGIYAFRGAELCLKFSFKHKIILNSMVLVCFMENIYLFYLYLKIPLHNQNLCFSRFSHRAVSPWEKEILQSHFEVILLPNALTGKLLLWLCKLYYINMTHTSTLSSNSATEFLERNMSRNLENGVTFFRGYEKYFFF